MTVEIWAQEICQRELRQEVVIHDDGTEPSMYDLRVGPRAAPEIAIECVRAVDDVREELWNVGPRRGALTLEIAGDWTVGLMREARMKRLKGLDAILRDCEGMGIRNVHVDWRLRMTYANLFAQFERLSVAWANCFRPHGSGKVYLTLDSIGGMVDEEGLAVVDWIGDFLRCKAQADVLSKLAASNASERHVVVPVGWGGAPWQVESYLTDGLSRLPTGVPPLPEPVTSVWIVSVQATHGIRWDGSKWHRFDARSASVAA